MVPVQLGDTISLTLDEPAFAGYLWRVVCHEKLKLRTCDRAAKHSGVVGGQSTVTLVFDVIGPDPSSIGLVLDRPFEAKPPRQRLSIDFVIRQDHEDIVAVTLSDGRVLNIHDYEFTPRTSGSCEIQPDTPEVTVNAAWWDDGDGEMGVHGSEIDTLMNGPEYDLILAACERRHDERIAAAMAGCEDEDV